MEFSGIGALGIYLVLAFVVPGFCYMFVFALCFPNEVAAASRVLRKPRGGHEGNLDKVGSVALALSEIIPAIAGGLLLSSVCFAIEVWLRGLGRYLTSVDVATKWLFPEINIARMAYVEASGRSVLTLQMAAGSAIMHLNVGLRIAILLVAYCIH